MEDNKLLLEEIYQEVLKSINENKDMFNSMTFLEQKPYIFSVLDDYKKRYDNKYINDIIIQLKSLLHSYITQKISSNDLIDYLNISYQFGLLT
jgi:hypothetical protein